ncbi:methyltransferase family protein [Spongisporangium articulatum]|uniref:Methyltransferase family protein n=1 Tax=Spongisporangium articulatum TaxID=3362603 RepID=A0ABW8AKD6_9ACTN
MAEPSPAEPSPAERPDLGRVVVVALFGLSTAAAVVRAVRALTRLDAGPQAALELAAAGLSIAFCTLVVRAYLGRSTASATDRGLGAWLAAPLTTCLPFLSPLLPSTVGSWQRSAVAFVLILVGTAWSVWAVRHLSTSLSVLPQARRLVDTGPYRWTRHPLYVGEVVAVTGFGVRAGHISHLMVVVGLVALQLYRAHREERLLAARLPGYAEYATRRSGIASSVK